MIADGYQPNDILENIDQDLLAKYTDIQNLYSEQQNIDQEIQTLSGEIEELPPMPRDLDYWIGSFNHPFTLQDYNHMFKIKKRYEQLMEKREDNRNKIKTFVIDGLLAQIKEIEDKKSNKV